MKENNQQFHTVRGYQLINKNDSLLTSAMEDYMEMIYRNIKQDGYMRINALSELLNVKPSSATKMVQKLTELELLDYKKYGIIFITEKGEKIGKFLLERHNIIERFLTVLGINENILVETELIEHNIGIDTLKNIDALNSFLEENPDIRTNFEEFKSRYFDAQET